MNAARLETLLERGRAASQALTAEFDGMAGVPSADDLRHLVLKRRLNDVVRAVRAIVLLHKKIKAARGDWRRKVRFGQERLPEAPPEQPVDECNDGAWPDDFEPPY